MKAIKKGGFKVPKFWGGINTSDKVFLTKYLALMLRVGTDLLSAINILIADFDKPAVRDFLLEVHDNLSRGQPFWQAFAKHPETFSPTFVSLVKAAEESGNLEKTFEDLSVSLESEAELRSQHPLGAHLSRRRHAAWPRHTHIPRDLRPAEARQRF